MVGKIFVCLKQGIFVVRSINSVVGFQEIQFSTKNWCAMNAIGQRVLFCRSLHMHIMVLGALLMFMYSNILDGDLSLKDFRFFLCFNICFVHKKANILFIYENCSQ